MIKQHKNFDISLYVVLDPSACAGRDVVSVTAAVLRGGATMLQYRDKMNPPEVVLANALKIKNMVDGLRNKMPSLDPRLLLGSPSPLGGVKRAEGEQGEGLKFLINDHVHIAAAIGADGVHLGQGDMNLSEARSILGPEAIIGLTAFTSAHFAALDPAVVDYAGTGPFYPTQTDKGKPVLGAAGFKALRALSPVPVVGIGGITPENARAVIDAGADGVAMMRSVTEAPDPEKSVRDFVRVLKTRHAA